MSTYALDNRHDAAPDHHAALAILFNPVSISVIEGLVDLPGKRVLEVGAGHGRMATWLADEVGPTGSVVAIDIAPVIAPHPQLSVVRHDLTQPRPWPQAAAGPFDLVFTRMTLQHLPTRDRILDELVARLAPGGTLLVQDLAGQHRGMVVAAPDPGAAELYERYQRIKTATFDDTGTDRGWATRVHQELVARDLRGVETSIHSSYWTAGGPGLALELALMRQLTPKLLARGLSQAELAAVRQLMHDPALIVTGHPLYSTAGRAGGAV